MESIFNIEGVFLDKDDNVSWTLNYWLTKEDIDGIKSHVLNDYIEENRKCLGPGIDQLHHINVTEFPIDGIIEHGDFLSEYVFLPDGSIYVSRNYKSIGSEDEFDGRSEGELPLKVGDKVMWFNGSGGVMNGVIYQMPSGKNSTFLSLDVFDDSYTVLVGLDYVPSNISGDKYMDLHEHIAVTKVFKRE